MAQSQRKLYQGAYRHELEEDVITPADPSITLDGEVDNTGTEDLTAEQRSWKKRYGDLRTHSNSLTERIKNLETQLLAAQKQEVKIPSSKEELGQFAQKYPDIYRHIRSIAMTELLQERESITQETNVVKEELEKQKRELGYRKITQAHPDFEELNLSENFHEWANAQPKQIQDWLYESVDPSLCIKAIDLYKAETNFKAKPTPRQGADSLVRTKTAPEMPNQTGNKKIWKASEIRKLHPKAYEKFEDDIELARVEGRIEIDE